MSDLGFTHIALEITDPERTIAFYEKYAGMKVIHRRRVEGSDGEALWMSDLTRPFVIVFIKLETVNAPLRPWAHMGVACVSREEVDRLCDLAREEGVLLDGPTQSPPPVGYWAFLRDPDGHTLELSFGQEIALTVSEAH